MVTILPVLAFWVIRHSGNLVRISATEIFSKGFWFRVIEIDWNVVANMMRGQACPNGQAVAGQKSSSSMSPGALHSVEPIGFW